MPYLVLQIFFQLLKLVQLPLIKLRTMTVIRSHINHFLIWNFKIRHIFIYLIFLVFVFTVFVSYKHDSAKSIDPISVSRLSRRQNDLYRLGESGQITSRPNVFFLKVHKSASSTIQNILMRYGDDNGLNFVLPYSANNLGHPEPFDPKMALPLSKTTDSYNIFCHHVRFNQMNIESVMPKGTIFITMLRDPVALFESLYSYYDLGSHYQMTLEELVKMPRWWLQTCDRYHDSYGTNQIAFDFGLEEVDLSDLPKIKLLINSLQNRFDLVMIAEHFHESLILMKHLLHLDDKDVVYFQHNQRKANAKRNLTLELAENVRKANHVDQLIYHHFLKLFQAKLKEFGLERMRYEVARLRNLTSYWINECGAKQVNNDQVDFIYRQFSSQVQSIQLTKPSDQFCQNLAKAEIPFTRELQSKHLNKHASWWLKFLYKIGYHHI